MSRIKLELGVPKTIGELRKMIETYPDNTVFGFSNQPEQMLCDSSIDGRTYAVVFEEIIPDNYQYELNLLRTFSTNIIMAISDSPNYPAEEIAKLKADRNRLINFVRLVESSVSAANPESVIGKAAKLLIEEIEVQE